MSISPKVNDSHIPTTNALKISKALPPFSYSSYAALNPSNISRAAVIPIRVNPAKIPVAAAGPAANANLGANLAAKFAHFRFTKSITELIIIFLFALNHSTNIFLKLNFLRNVEMDFNIILLIRISLRRVVTFLSFFRTAAVIFLSVPLVNLRVVYRKNKLFNSPLLSSVPSFDFFDTFELTNFSRRTLNFFARSSSFRKRASV